MKQYEFMDWESDNWGDGDLSDDYEEAQHDDFGNPPRLMSRWLRCSSRGCVPCCECPRLSGMTGCVGGRVTVVGLHRVFVTRGLHSSAACHVLRRNMAGSTGRVRA